MVVGQVAYKILNVLAAKDWISRQEIIWLTGMHNMQSQQTLYSLLHSGNVERMKCGTRYYYWRITESGQQEHEKLKQKYGPILLDEAYLKAIKNRDIDVMQQRSSERLKLKLYMKEQEAKIKESFKYESQICRTRQGIEKYFLYDRSNPVDAEIVRLLFESCGNSTKYQERLCRRILCSRLSLGRCFDYSGADQRIEQALLHRCLKNGKTRNEYVRELFCVYFNIKEGVQTHNPDLTQKDFCTLVSVSST